MLLLALALTLLFLSFFMCVCALPSTVSKCYKINAQVDYEAFECIDYLSQSHMQWNHISRGFSFESTAVNVDNRKSINRRQNAKTENPSTKMNFEVKRTDENQGKTKR